MRCFIQASVTEIVAQVYFALAQVRDSRFSGQNIIRDDRPANSLAQLDLRFVFLKFAASNEQGSPDSLKGMAPLLFAIPLHKPKAVSAAAPSSTALNMPATGVVVVVTVVVVTVVVVVVSAKVAVAIEAPIAAASHGRIVRYLIALPSLPPGGAVSKRAIDGDRQQAGCHHPPGRLPP